jgi:hypothetical protein
VLSQSKCYIRQNSKSQNQQHFVLQSTDEKSVKRHGLLTPVASKEKGLVDVNAFLSKRGQSRPQILRRLLPPASALVSRLRTYVVSEKEGLRGD